MIDETGERLGSSAGSDVKASAESGIKSTRDVLKAGTDEAMRDAKSMIRSAAEEQKERAAEGLDGVAKALHEAARNLGENQTTARYADMAADQVERVSQMLRNKDWGALIDNAEDFARRNPAVFVGGAMAAGFMLARFMKSGRSRSYERYERGYGARSRSGYAGTAYSQAGTGTYSTTSSSASSSPRTYVPPESGEFREPGTAAREVFGGREPGIDNPATGTSSAGGSASTSTTTPRSASDVRGGDI